MRHDSGVLDEEIAANLARGGSSASGAKVVDAVVLDPDDPDDPDDQIEMVNIDGRA